MPESDRWKSVAYDQIMEQLEGAKVAPVSEWMLGPNAKILIFEDNDKAEKFNQLISIVARK